MIRRPGPGSGSKIYNPVNKNTLVSVIIPTYNRAATLERTLESVLAQTWQPLEVIVVDSHSTDRTAEILDRYQGRIRVSLQPKLGPGAARNAGIRMARGEIISFVDSDDTWLSDKTERQMRLLQAGESLGVQCCVCNARMEQTARVVYSFATANLHPAQREGLWTNPAEVLTTRFLFFNQVVAVRRELLEQIGCFREDLKLNEDYELALRLSLMGPWAFVADPLVVWHEHTDNLSVPYRNRQLEVHQSVLQILKELSGSSQFGPRFPKAVLGRRMRGLEQSIRALHLSAQTDALPRLWGRCLQLGQRGAQAVSRRLSLAPRMVTRPL